MNETDLLKYSNYLKKRNFKGLLYRKYFLYPIISKNLKGKCLDIGCGIGDFLKFRGKNTFGVDINKNTIEYCLTQKLNVKFYRDIIPHKNEEFDSIVLDNVLEHIEKPNLLIEEMHRVLKNNGKLLIGVPGLKGFESDSDHKKFYDEMSMLDVISKSLFKDIKFFYTPFKSNFLNKYLKQYCLYGLFEKK